MLVPVMAPSSVLVPSPKSIDALWITVPLPVDAAIDPVNATSVPAVGFVVLLVIETAGCGLGLTATDVEAVFALPKVSVTVARME